MGRVNITGLGVVDIEGDTPNEEEIAVFQRMIEAKGTAQIVDGPAEEITQSFMSSPAFGRLLTEAGLAIAGTIATGGLALPGIALRAGMLARPFLTQLAKSSVGAGIGGGTGAAVAQTFDPKEDVIKEILRAATEGALAEAVGAPLVIKGAQVAGKFLGSSNPKAFNDLLDGAKEAEFALQSKGVQILKGIKPSDFGKLDPKEQKKILKEITSKGFVADTKTVTEFAEAAGLKTTAKQVAGLEKTAIEIAQGLTPGVKSSNRTLEIIENIAQKSIVGGGAITTRYQAAKEVGDIIARDVLEEFKQGAAVGEAEIGRFFLESLGGAEGAFKATKNKLYKQVDDILLQKGALNTEVIPVNTLKNTVDDITRFYTESPAPEALGSRVASILKNFEARGGKYSFSQLDKLRKGLQDDFARLPDARSRQYNGKLIEDIDSILADPKLSQVIPKEAVDALNVANKFMREGNNVFTRGITSTLLKKAGEDGIVASKDAKAVQNVFKQVAGQDNILTAKAMFREIDALTGKAVPKDGVFEAIPKLVDPKTGKPLLSVKQGNMLKQSIKGHYLSNALSESVSGSEQFGKFYNADKFTKALDKRPELRKFLFEGKDATKLAELENTLAFAQGDLSRLPGLPGGIFIQLKQAGAAGQLLQLGQAGTIGLAGYLGGIVPAAGILLAPAVASKIMLNPKFSNLIFKESAKLVSKGENTPSKMAVLYRQILGRMFTDGLISESDRDDALAQVDNMERTMARQTASMNNQAMLPNVTPSNFPVINQGGNIGGQGSNTELAQALNLFNKGGIVSATKVNS